VLALTFDWITDPNAWIALLTLTALEIILGVDNIVFITIQTGRLPAAQRPRARRIGLGLAMVMRIALLMMLSLIMEMTRPLFAVAGNEISGRDIVLILGGIFLLVKSTLEIHHQVEGHHETHAPRTVATFGSTLVQIALLDMVFSLDSVITAVGTVDHREIMILAVVISIVVMVLFVNSVSEFVERHPTFKMLALSFLVLIGVALIADGLALHIPKGYVYFAMAFSLVVELLNMRLRRKAAATAAAAEPSAAGGHDPQG
jgi:predicted tellurium resistance membrane protein TerC